MQRCEADLEILRRERDKAAQNKSALEQPTKPPAEASVAVPAESPSEAAAGVAVEAAREGQAGV